MRGNKRTTNGKRKNQSDRRYRKYKEVCCPMCHVMKRYLPDQPSMKGGGSVWAWVNLDGTRHRCWNHMPKVILDVPYEEKEDAKARGAVWHPRERVWWTKCSEDAVERFAAWNPRIVGPRNAGLSSTYNKGKP